MFYFAIALVIYLLLNGLFMLSMPHVWFHQIPGLSASGSFNAHFIIDIGITYTLAGISIFWHLLDRVRGRSAALFATGFLCLHAGYHFSEWLISPHHQSHLLVDVIGIYLPACVALLLITRVSSSSPEWFERLTRPIAHRAITKFENTWAYDATYMHDIAKADCEAIARFTLLQELGDYRKGIPVAAWYTVKLMSSIREDCGPCTQLIVRMAEREGVASSIIAAVVEGRRENLDEATRLFYDYAEAVLNHDINADDIRTQISSRYSGACLVSAGLAMITGKAYPLMKYALGHGQHCARVLVGGASKNVASSSTATVDLY